MKISSQVAINQIYIVNQEKNNQIYMITISKCHGD